MQFEEKTAHDLEWHRLVRHVVSRCVGPGSALEHLPLAESPAEARAGLARTAEALHQLRLGDPLPLDGLVELNLHLARVSRLGALEGGALRDIAAVLAAARKLRRYLQQKRADVPMLMHIAHFDPSLDALYDTIARAVEPDGRLRDDASHELRKLRGEVSALRGRIIRKLESMLIEHESIVQDRFFTIREGRFVVPVRRDAHEKIPGIVHGTSGSGASVFIEPRPLVAQGNRLKMAQSEMEQEELRILSELTDRVRDELASVRSAFESLCLIDLHAASAKFGRELDAHVLPLSEAPEVHLKQARHSLLHIDGVEVVPTDFDLRAGQAVVISGPNAGGKTVALKLLGLTALMMRAGLPVPALEGSSCGFFSPVLTDIGDDQSITRNLSTFSAHVVNLIQILQKAEHGALVLLDELAGSTDPGEGSALATAVVEDLVSAGAAVVVSTHYDRLKAAATSDERIHNASVGFDSERMEPTFAIMHGLPGPSSALMVARRFGVPERVLQRAETLVPAGATAYENLVLELQRLRGSLERGKAALEEREFALKKQETALSEAKTALKEERVRLREKRSDEVLRNLRDADQELKQLRRSLRDETRREEDLLAAKQTVERIRKDVRKSKPGRSLSGSPAQTGEGAADLQAGAQVWVPRLQKNATVLELRGNDTAYVVVGPVKMTLSASELQPPRVAKAKATRSVAAKTAKPKSPRMRTTANTVDLRGMRADEAISSLESFLDRSYGNEEAIVYALHGHGTGALKVAIRQWLRNGSAYVKSYGAAEREEGGDAFTAIELV